MGFRLLNRSLWSVSLSLGWMLAAALPSRTAETLRVTWADINIDLPVAVLETFQKTGRFDRGFSFLNVIVPESTLKEARSALGARLPLSSEVLRPVLTNSDTLGIFLQQVGTLIRPEAGESGATALRQALLAASEQPQGLTLLGLIQAFPSPRLQLDVDTGLRLFQQIRALEAQTATTLQAIAIQMQQQAPATTDNYQLAQRGAYAVRQQSWEWDDRDRDRPIPSFAGERHKHHAVPTDNCQSWPALAAAFVLRSPAKSLLSALLEHESAGTTAALYQHPAVGGDWEKLGSGPAKSIPAAAHWLPRALAGGQWHPIRPPLDE